jgi:predicted amidohydrolase YtcJ
MSANEQLYIGGEIVTVDDKIPSAEAVAVRAGQILEVGSESRCRSLLGSDFEMVDLKGRTLLPGFIDIHLHPVPLVFYDMNVDLRGVGTIEELQGRLRVWAQANPSGQWVVGLRFEEQDLADPRLPTRHDLDAACPDRPAIVIKHDGHTVMANTRAIEAAGVTAATDDPEGGVISREPDGFPAGAFYESAMQIPLGAMTVPDLDALVQGAKLTFSRIASCGITSVGAILQTDEEGPSGSLGQYDVMALQMLLNHIPISLYGILVASDIAKVEDALKTTLNGGESGGHRIGGIKIFSDGTFGSCTALMNEPFSDQPDKRGFLTQSEEEIYRRMVMAQKAGMQLAIHAIGDAANRICVDLYDRLLQEHPRVNHRHRLEHASLLSPALVTDIARLGLIASVQPLFIHSEKSWLPKRLGSQRCKWVYPFRALLDAGVRMAGSSDAPIETLDILHSIECCVTREGFETQQVITPLEAVRMFTLHAAYAQFEESLKGSITPGKRADLVILSGNPVTVPPDRIRDIRVERTMRGAQVIFQA